MKDIDQELKQAMRRCEPSPGFADRVLAQLEQERARTRLRPRVRLLQWPALRWAVAAVLLISIGTGLAYRHEQRVEEADAIAAKQQVMLALRITRSKLRVAKQRVKAVERAQKTEKTL